MKTGCGNNEKTEPSEFEIFHEISLEDGNYFLLITESTQQQHTFHLVLILFQAKIMREMNLELLLSNVEG